MGDFNWICPQFLAFASPQSQPVDPIPITSPGYSALPSTIPEIAAAKITQPFKNVLSHFVERDIGLVVRLNSELYCPTYFTALGIQHIDMIFEDGTCPALPIVRKFIGLAHGMIAKEKGIAVHCKAGLGRTGCLIGAYLIYRHGFTANEIIAYMRFMRPGMVVGPQQHWLHLNQGTFREWWLEDQWKAKMESIKPLTPRGLHIRTPLRAASGGQMATPPNRSSQPRAALGEIDGNDVQNGQQWQDENLPAPTPGQPRKYMRQDSRHHPYVRSASGTLQSQVDKPETEMVTVKTHRHGQDGNGAESEEEIILQRLSAKRSVSRSPNNKAKGRSVSYTTTTTTTTKHFDDIVGNTMGIYEDSDCALDDIASESGQQLWEEMAHESSRSARRNSNGGRPKTPGTARTSGSGMMSITKTRSGTVPSSSPSRRSYGEEKIKVRKTSGRVGSANHAPYQQQQQASVGAKR